MNQKKLKTPTELQKGKVPYQKWLWLLAGMILIVATNMRWGIGILAFVAPLPILWYLRITSGFRSRLVLAIAMPVAWTLVVLKIITAPIPVWAAFGFGIPFGLIFLLPYLMWDWIRRCVDDWRAVLVFPAMMVGAEWVQSRFTSLGSWASAAYTQLDNLPLLQMASLFGVAGVGWVVYGVGAALDRAIVSNGWERKRWLIAMVGVVFLSHGYGFLRLATALTPKRVARVAAVVTDATFGGPPFPSKEAIKKIEDKLLERTYAAAKAGAVLVVWTEGATLVPPERQEAWLTLLANTARSLHIELVVSYLVPLPTETVRYENKYVWFRPNGQIDHIYLKHKPVPGEPARAGVEPPVIVNTAFGHATGAICYDYDFPYLAAQHARKEVDIVALPSSDWKGIDPVHAQMASLRAIEGGFSIIRSTRMGLSAGIDPYGRLRGWLSSYESSERLLFVTLPTAFVPTLYKMIGDVLVYIGFCHVIWVVFMVAYIRRQTRIQRSWS